jgi:hypothetical protein
MEGAFSPYRALAPEDKEIFGKAYDGIAGAKWTPFAVSTQVVAGTNYRFLCGVSLVTAKPVEKLAIAKIFRSLDGEVTNQGDLEVIIKE